MRGARVACLIAAALLVPLRPAHGQEEGEGRRGVGFASLDVFLGGSLPQKAEAGISYGGGTDIANLLVRGALLRVGFRFWSVSDAVGARTVEIDDFALLLLLRRRFTDGGASLYGSAGAGLHFVSARFDDRVTEKEARDGFRPGLEAQLGIELALAEDGFVNAFVEASGSLVDAVSHVSAEAGVRLRFDAFGGR